MALDSYLRELGFKKSMSDPCIYASTGGEEFSIGIYVDDIMLLVHLKKTFKRSRLL